MKIPIEILENSNRNSAKNIQKNENENEKKRGSVKVDINCKCREKRSERGEPEKKVPQGHEKWDKMAEGEFNISKYI